jgi:hypothetical protein
MPAMHRIGCKSPRGGRFRKARLSASGRRSRLRDSAQVLTNFRLASQPTLLPLASALHATAACFRATFSALDTFAATGMDR